MVNGGMVGKGWWMEGWLIEGWMERDGWKGMVGEGLLERGG